MADRLGKAELIELVEKIIRVEGTEQETNEWVRLFEQNVLHPEASGLIFWSSDYGLGPSPSAQEIVEAALRYKPIYL